MSEEKKYQDTGERPAEKKVHTEEEKPDAERLYDEELLSRIENAAARGAQIGSRYGILLATMITLLLIVAAVFILPVFFGIDKKVSDVPSWADISSTSGVKQITIFVFFVSFPSRTDQK